MIQVLRDLRELHVTQQGIIPDVTQQGIIPDVTQQGIIPDVTQQGDDGALMIGRAMRKRFGDGIVYRGRVTGKRTLDELLPAVEVYAISYEDGDSEELELFELTPLLYKRPPPDMMH